jgi:arylsulfatase A-like enzyme
LNPRSFGTTGIFSGHKFSLFEGGIRVPALLSWGTRLKSRTVDAPHIAMDIFPTVLEACGGNIADYSIDGKSLLPMLLNGEDCTHEYLFWEMEDQNAVRYGDYKLVLNGRLTEGEAPRAPVFLSDLSKDPGEKNNLSEELPDLCMKLTATALEWRAGIEKTWAKEFAKNYSLTR